MTAGSLTGKKLQLIDAAEHAFADFGFEGASLRDIVRAAGANLAAVSYYFGSKDGLIEAVIKRRFEPLVGGHLRLLREFESLAKDGVVTAEQIVEAMLRPSVELASSSLDQTAAVVRLIGRIVTEPHEPSQALVRQQFTDLRTSFEQALSRAYPAASRRSILWSIEFVWGAMAFVMSSSQNIREQSGGLCDIREDPEVFLVEMTKFFAGGLRQALGGGSLG